MQNILDYVKKGGERCKIIHHWIDWNVFNNKGNKTRKGKSIEIKQNRDNIFTKISFISNEADVQYIFLTFNNQIQLNWNVKPWI